MSGSASERSEAGRGATGERERPGAAAGPAGDAGATGGPPASGGAGDVADPVEAVAAAAEAAEAERDRALEKLARAIAPSSLGDVGFQIPWQHRLTTKLIALLGAVSVVTIGAFAFAEMSVQAHVMAEVVRETDLLSETIRNAIHRAMLRDHQSDAYLVMDDIGKHPGMERVRIMDKEGKITFSTRRDEIGTTVDRDAEQCSACHKTGEPLHRLDLQTRARVYDAEDHRDTSCSTASCHAHPAEKQVLGVMDVGRSLAAHDVALREFRGRTLLVAAASALLLVLFFWKFTQRHLVRPIAALVQGTRRVARDQLDLEVPVTWRGELGLLAASFNEMTRSLRKAHADLHHLLENLEHQVQERTLALRTAQDQLVRSEKLSSLGKLSASIAHEINNPLAGILTFAKLMIRTIEEGPLDDAKRKTLVKNLLLVQRESERCSAIVRNLLDFARERPLAVKEISVNAVVEEAISLLGNQVSIQDVKLVRKLGAVPQVQGDFGQLRQACVNVIMNACDAMGRGGTLTIESALVDNGRIVEVSFTDTGGGIAPEVLTKIFDPFFTTKEKGTGLGLSVVYGIVERHGGKIDIRTAVGKGTRVAIRLPARAAGGAA
jgi:two-component system NtrC family sensor kinase